MEITQGRPLFLEVAGSAGGPHQATFSSVSSYKASTWPEKSSTASLSAYRTEGLSGARVKGRSLHAAASVCRLLVCGMFY